MMIDKKLVSILTPAYNSREHIYKLLDSIIGQTYDKIEMFVIDDGSTDDTAKVVKSYIEKFKERGYKLNYVYQNNQGQSSAINNGLKLINGHYLVWPDADDYYSSEKAIAKMVECLNGSDESVSMVRIEGELIDEGNEKVIKKFELTDDTRYKTDLFEDYLFNNTPGNTMWVVAGGYMIKVDKLDELIAKREIYTEKMAGQNFQIILPLLYGHKCLTIEDNSYKVVYREASHSHDVSTIEKRRIAYKRTAFNTINRMDIDKDYKKYLIRRYLNLNDFSVDKPPHIRTLIKRAIKFLLPYGLMMLYKRRRT